MLGGRYFSREPRAYFPARACGSRPMTFLLAPGSVINEGGNIDGEDMPARRLPTQHAEHQTKASSAHILSNLLVGCDGSASATMATAFALRLSESWGSRVTLLHATRNEDEIKSNVEEFGQPWSGSIKRLVDDSPATDNVSLRIDQGGAADALLAAALEKDTDGVLVGSRSSRRILGALLGRTPQKLLHQAQCSVIVFPERSVGEEMRRPTAVLVGIDESRESSYALRLGESLAVAFSAKLTLLHAHNPLLSIAASAGKSAAGALRSEANSMLQSGRSTVVAPLDVIETRILLGDPRPQILGAAQQELRPLIVVGSRGSGGFPGLLLGSTAAWIAAHATCPAVVARDPAARN